MLIEAIGNLLPSAIGVALSPVPVIAVILMLATPQARKTGPAFALGWVTGLVVVSVVVLLVTDGASDSDSTASDGVNWFQVVVGALFLFMAARQWQSRPRGDAEPEMPKWMSTIDTFTPIKCVGLGALLSGANPKNLALTAAAAASISQADLSTGGTAAAVAVFVFLASITVVGPVLYYLVASEQASGPLATLKEFLSVHNTAIMMAILLILGVKLLGEGFGAIA
jgi:threonine/homoserine/homoserine lactone efflux protein